MIQIGIGSLFVWLFFRFADKQNLVDGMSAVAFVLAPALAIFLLSIGIKALLLSDIFLLPLNLLYFVFPLLMLKAMSELSWKRASAYSGVVFGIVILVQTFTLVAIQSASV